MSAFNNLYRHGFARVAACTVPVALADPAENTRRIIDQVRACHEDDVALALFPELSITGYSLDDLFLDDVLLDAADAAIAHLAAETASLRPLVIVGAPVRRGSRLFNCAIAIQGGKVIAVSPKTYLPNYREFYEERYFASGAGLGGHLRRPLWPTVDGNGLIPFGSQVLIEVTDVPGMTVHMEVCEDMWVPIPPSHRAALAGATVLTNLSASPITITRADDRHLLARSSSSRCNAAYLYAAASAGESTTDLSWDGMTMIYEMGQLLAETERFPTSAARSVADIDLDRFRQERARVGSFDDARLINGLSDINDPDDDAFTVVSIALAPPTGELPLRREIDRFPFVPNDEADLALDCYEAYNIQVTALVQRMRSIAGGDPKRLPKLVIGVSGGLDSTHALLVAAQACDRAGVPRSHVQAYTLPGFATSESTKSNALALATAVQATVREVDITGLATSMLQALGHPAGFGEAHYDVTYENVQAGLRTDFLFRAANECGGIVVGTGDLSELALGWCTFGVGDQMSHYGVNGGIPKTLIQHIIRWVISTEQFDGEVDAVLESILGTEISPELIPVGPGERPQSTQATIGPYALHDFTLFYVIRRGYRPSKIAFLAASAWADAARGDWPVDYPQAERVEFELVTIKSWMTEFYRRFFRSQFKRSTLPNGPKVVSGGSLSPRGDWRMPSDALATAWLAELDTIPDR